MQSPIRSIVVFDLETTGLSASREIIELEKKIKLSHNQEERLNLLRKEKDKTKPAPHLYCIAEIAATPFSSSLVDLKEYESGIIKPYDLENRSITEGALMANGITMNQLNNGIDSQKIADEFAKYLVTFKIGKNKPILCGHNILSFDIPFLSDFFKIHNHKLEDYVDLDFSIDTMWWCRVKWEEQVNYQLGTCCEKIGVELTDAHRAIRDTRANKNLVKDLIRSLRSDKKSEDKEYVRPRFQF